MVRPTVLQGKTEREVAFLLARRLAYMRPEYYLRMLLPTNTELKVVVLSAIAMLQPGFPVPPTWSRRCQQYLPEMQKRIPPHALEQLGVVVQRFVQATPEIDLAKWGHAVDAASHRAGFVACGDLEVAARAVAVEPVVVDGPNDQGQGQRARAVLDQRGVLRGARAAGADDRRLAGRWHDCFGVRLEP